MAYLKEEKENLEVSYPLNAIWEAIPKVIEKLDWKIIEKDDCIILKLKLKVPSYLTRQHLKLNCQ